MSNYSELINLTNKEAESFEKQFFKALDIYRENLFKFMTADAPIVWNGTPIPGGESFIQMYNNMPQTRHEVTDFNAQPLPNSSANQLNMMLQASGKVTFGSERGKNLHAFSCTLFLKKEPSASEAKITSMTYRLVHKPHDSTVQM
ncbi:hypothetical protein TRVA0_075S00144 [Trichomonascus vanleenenianus]|uniref:uncharacterized protein n=1 Tax=Trichomonascus vanleenenianus TaxID=2268995 RepID=UPI003ECB4006